MKYAAAIFLAILCFSQFSNGAELDVGKFVSGAELNAANFPDSGIQGTWKLLQQSIGISAMHMQLMHDDKVVIYDRTDFGQSNISLPFNRCRINPNDTILTKDCTAHSVLYDTAGNSVRALWIQTDTWCSSGAVLPNGTLIQTGGFNDGDRIVRSFTTCEDGQCDWKEFPGTLSRRRWYATNAILPGGQIIIVGGRVQFNYEFLNPPSPAGAIPLDFLKQTMDPTPGVDNNLYPFLHLLPDGNLYIFANKRSILFNYKTGKVIKEFAQIPGTDSRNYPSTGSSVLLPIVDQSRGLIEAEVMICGGSPPDNFSQGQRKVFRPVSNTCGRLKVTDANPVWKMETMPSGRVMGDMLILPDGGVLIINGASSGSAGWDMAVNPVTTPVIYSPDAQEGKRFRTVAAGSRPRMYHSTAILMSDGRVLVGGSNPHQFYNFTNEQFPTDLSLESFTPPYLAPIFDTVRPTIAQYDEIVHYNKRFSVKITASKFPDLQQLSVRMVAPSFTTHSFAMNQRMVVLRKIAVKMVAPFTYLVTARAPSSAQVAPQGYYMLFVGQGAVPSKGVWVSLVD